MSHVSRTRLFKECQSPLIAAILCVGCALAPALGAPPPDRAPTPVSLRLIVVESPEKAQRTLELLKGGADFAVLAKETSMDPVPADGGFMGDVDHAGNHGNDWISLRRLGVKANRSAIGARIKVTVENGGQGARAIYRTVAWADFARQFTAARTTTRLPTENVG